MPVNYIFYTHCGSKVQRRVLIHIDKTNIVHTKYNVGINNIKEEMILVKSQHFSDPYSSILLKLMSHSQNKVSILIKKRL